MRKKTEGFTFIQQIYIDAIEKIRSRGLYPIITYDMIAKEVGVNSRSTIYDMLKRLEEKGYKFNREVIRKRK